MTTKPPISAITLLFVTTALVMSDIHVPKSAHPSSTHAFGFSSTSLIVQVQLPEARRRRSVCKRSLPTWMCDNEHSIDVSSSSAEITSIASSSSASSPLSKSSSTTTTKTTAAAGSSMSSATSLNTMATSSTTSTNEYSFFDEASIYVRAGSGGQGASTYKKGLGVNNHQNGPPDGGDGGRGGNVVLRLDSSLNTLAGLSRYAYRPNSFGGGGAAAFQKRKVGSGGGGGADSSRILSFRAENGADGGRQNKRGGVGKDVVVRVPPGTIVQEEIIVSDDGDRGNGDNERCHHIDIGTITNLNPTIIVASGGAGGEGSAVTSERHQQRGTRRVRAPPRPGERMRLKLTLQVVADVALVAVPNAGKSTLLSKVTRAKPKIADYPFTTVVPNLGVWVPRNEKYENGYKDDCVDDSEDDFSIDEYGNPISTSRNGGNSLILCDVPGLIAGASDGVGLGHAFLRHVERCHVILHLLDATSPNVIEEYAMINRELLNYGTGKLAAMPQVVVVNKVDVAFVSSPATNDDNDNSGCFQTKEELESKLLEVMPHSRIMWISAKEEDGVDDLMERVAMFVKKVKSAIVAKEDNNT